MDYQTITIPLLFAIIVLNFGIASPINQKQDTEAIYVPYDVTYVPVEVPEELLKVEALNSKNQKSIDQVFLKKDDILKYINNEAIEPVKSIPNDGDSNLISVPLSTITQGLQTTKNLVKVQQDKDIIVVPLSAISNTPKFEADPKEDLVIVPITSAADSIQVSHKIAKRQAQRQRFPGFRPFIRITGVSANRQRFRPSRKHALVGYLSDRDYFPTVA